MISHSSKTRLFPLNLKDSLNQHRLRLPCSSFFSPTPESSLFQILFGFPPPVKSFFTDLKHVGPCLFSVFPILCIYQDGNFRPPYLKTDSPPMSHQDCSFLSASGTSIKTQTVFPTHLQNLIFTTHYLLICQGQFPSSDNFFFPALQLFQHPFR